MQSSIESVTTAFELLQQAAEGLSTATRNEAAKIAISGAIKQMQTATERVSIAEEFAEEVNRLCINWLQNVSTRLDPTSTEAAVLETSLNKAPKTKHSERTPLQNSPEPAIQQGTMRNVKATDDSRVFERMGERGKQECVRRLGEMASSLAIKPDQREPYYNVYQNGKRVDNIAKFMRDFLDITTHQSGPRILSGIVEFLIGERTLISFDVISTNPNTDTYSQKLAEKWNARRNEPRFSSPVPLDMLIKRSDT